MHIKYSDVSHMLACQFISTLASSSSFLYRTFSCLLLPPHSLPRSLLTHLLVIPPIPEIQLSFIKDIKNTHLLVLPPIPEIQHHLSNHPSLSWTGTISSHYYSLSLNYLLLGINYLSIFIIIKLFIINYYDYIIY